MKCYLYTVDETGVFPFKCDRCKRFVEEAYYINRYDTESDEEEKELEQYITIEFKQNEIFWRKEPIICLCIDCIVELSKKFPMKIFGGSRRYLGKWINGKWIDNSNRI